VVRGLEHVAQWHFERILHLARIQQQLESRPHERHYGRNAKAADDEVIWQIADDGDVVRLQPDLLMRFTQRRGHQ
jgi:hypothetical protein